MRKIVSIVWMSLLVVVPAAIVTWYFVSQRQRIVDLDERELGHAADDLSQMLAVSADSVANLGGDPSYTCVFMDQQRYLELVGDNCSDFGTNPVRAFDLTKPALPKAAVWYTASSAGLTLHTDVRARNNRTLQFRIRLNTVLDELLVRDDFEHLFVTDASGTVLFQVPRGRGRRWQEQLHWLDREARDQEAVASGPLRLRSIQELLLPNGSKTSFSELSRSTNSVPARIAQVSRRVHLQPVRDLSLLDTRKDGKQSTLAPVIFLGGLVNNRASPYQAL